MSEQHRKISKLFEGDRQSNTMPRRIDWKYIDRRIDEMGFYAGPAPKVSHKVKMVDDAIADTDRLLLEDWDRRFNQWIAVSSFMELVESHDRDRQEIKSGETNENDKII